MIQTEITTINDKQFNRTYSDNGMMIERDGIQYEEAIDPIDSDRTYIETDIPIENTDEEATILDYQEALSEMGVQVND